MPGASVRWRRLDEDFEVVGHGGMWFRDQTTVVAATEVIGPASITELRRAVDRCRREKYDGDYRFEIYDAPPEQLAFDEGMFMPLPVSIELADRRTFLTLELPLAPEEEAQNRFEVAMVLSPLLMRSRAKLIEFSADTEMTATVYRLTIEIGVRGRTVGDAVELGVDLLRLWEASAGGGFTPATVADLLRAQRPELLIGQPEAEWFEAKQAPYGLGENLEEIELAKDVAALANRPEGGLLVIGLVTAKQGGRDVVKRVRTQTDEPAPAAAIPPEPRQVDLSATARPARRGGRGRAGPRVADGHGSAAARVAVALPRFRRRGWEQGARQPFLASAASRR